MLLDKVKLGVDWATQVVTTVPVDTLRATVSRHRGTPFWQHVMQVLPRGAWVDAQDPQFMSFTLEGSLWMLYYEVLTHLYTIPGRRGMTNLPGLLVVMTEMRRLVALPDNDFAWSAWRDHQAALADMDRSIATLTQGAVPDLAWLFAPTGPLQEVSLRSGWGAEFLALAARFDAAMTHHT